MHKPEKKLPQRGTREFVRTLTRLGSLPVGARTVPPQPARPCPGPTAFSYPDMRSSVPAMSNAQSTSSTPRLRWRGIALVALAVALGVPSVVEAAPRKADSESTTPAVRSAAASGTSSDSTAASLKAEARPAQEAKSATAAGPTTATTRSTAPKGRRSRRAASNALPAATQRRERAAITNRKSALRTDVQPQPLADPPMAARAVPPASSTPAARGPLLALRLASTHAETATAGPGSELAALKVAPAATGPNRPSSGGSGPSSSTSGKKKISLDEFLVEGTLEKPSAYYILRRSQLEHDWARLDARFSPLVLESVQDPLF